jgi:hypothetical protein
MMIMEIGSIGWLRGVVEGSGIGGKRGKGTGDV